MDWKGEWRNQYGSVLRVTDDADGRIAGAFRTALEDSGFAGEEAEVSGAHRGACINWAFTRSGDAGDTICSFTGLLRDGKIETLWHVVSDSAIKAPRPGAEPELMKLPWAHAVLTNADTWERTGDRIDRRAVSG